MRKIIKITIGLFVMCLTGCTISVDQTTLDFGSTETLKTFTLTVQGPVEWFIECSESWVTVSPSEGRTTETITVTVDRAGLDLGSYEAQLEIYTNYKIQTQIFILMVARSKFLTPACA